MKRIPFSYHLLYNYVFSFNCIVEFKHIISFDMLFEVGLQVKQNQLFNI